MGSYKLLMQVVPPRDRITVFEGQCKLLSERSLFSASGLSRGLQSLLGPQPGDLGRRPTRHSPFWTGVTALRLSLFCQNLLLISASWHPPTFPQTTENLSWIFFPLRGTQICQHGSDQYQWQREGRAWPPSSLLTPVLTLGDLETVSNDLLNWEFLWEHSVVLLVTKDERPYICLLSFINVSLK